MKAKQDFPSINERPAEGLKPDGTAYRVLIVDDSMFVAKQLGQILTSEGYEVIATAVDGMDGIEKYKQYNTSRRHRRHRSRYKYNLFVLDKNGQKAKIFGGIYSESHAKRMGEEILACVKNKAFPCQVKY